VGVVEQIGVKGREAFTDCDELWEILSSSKKIGLINKEKKPTLLSKKLILGANDERRFSEDAHTMAPRRLFNHLEPTHLNYFELTT